MDEERFHQAYLVRLWAVHHDGDLVWRASAENVHTGGRHAFTDLVGLFEFLQTEIDSEQSAHCQVGQVDVQTGES